MAYVDIATLQTIAPGEVFTAATLQQIRDNQEFFIDPPACSITETSAQALTHNVGAALTADEENYDNDSMHSTSSNTSRITIQTPGRYLLSAVVLFASNTSGRRSVTFKLNGTTDYDVLQVPPASGASTRISGSRTLVLAQGDFVECYAFQTSGGTLDAFLVEFAALFLTK